MTKLCLKHLHPDSPPLILRSKPQIKLFKHLCAAFSLGLSPCLTKLSTREQITFKFRSVGRAPITCLPGLVPRPSALLSGEETSTQFFWRRGNSLGKASQLLLSRACSLRALCCVVTGDCSQQCWVGCLRSDKQHPVLLGRGVCSSGRCELGSTTQCWVCFDASGACSCGRWLCV